MLSTWNTTMQLQQALLPQYWKKRKLPNLAVEPTANREAPFGLGLSPTLLGSQVATSKSSHSSIKRATSRSRSDLSVASLNQFVASIRLGFNIIARDNFICEIHSFLSFRQIRWTGENKVLPRTATIAYKGHTHPLYSVHNQGKTTWVLTKVKKSLSATTGGWLRHSQGKMESPHGLLRDSSPR